MARNLEAAFHHAGHAVAAHWSKYHCVAAPLRVDVYGAGEVVAALSRRKLIAAEKVASAAARVDPDVARSIAVILCAGLVSEQLAAAKSLAVEPDPARSKGDFEMARAELVQAGMRDDMQSCEDAAATLLSQHWRTVQRLADRLARVEELAPDEIAATIEAD